MGYYRKEAGLQALKVLTEVTTLCMVDHVKKVLQCMRHKEACVRKAAVSLMGVLTQNTDLTKTLLLEIVKTLDDEDENYKLSALRVLRNHGEFVKEEGYVEDIYTVLNTYVETMPVRIEAFYTLGANNLLRAEHMRPAVSLLQTTEVRLLGKLTSVFRKMGHKIARLTPLIMDAVRPTDPNGKSLKRKLIRFMFRYYEPEIASAEDAALVTKMIGESDSAIKTKAIALLATTPDFAPVESIVTTLRGNDPNVLRQSARLLGDIGRKSPQKMVKIMEGIIKLLSGPSKEEDQSLGHAVVLWRTISICWNCYVDTSFASYGYLE